ncbi:MAG: hypothetical protein DWQ42_16235 [Planctomycetota bacterium]|nr:MAG: hypothetical protein DWQ42_16235 [Planctomycetota bacterium]REK37441.1 MAG: hypothetical protein DWQ46_22440 [Planctomycetota bacterium]
MAATASSLRRDPAAARSGMYRLLARLWLQEVDAALLAELCRQPLGEAFVAAGGVLPAASDEVTTVLEPLAVDYCRLFIGPSDHLPPYQSVWQTGQFQGATIPSLEAFIDVIGYDVDRLPSGTMLDHLGVQLDMLGHVLGEVATMPSDEAWQIADAFFYAHLRWPIELLTAAADRADSPFYRAVVEMTRAFLESEVAADSRAPAAAHDASPPT